MNTFAIISVSQGYHVSKLVYKFEWCVYQKPHESRQPNPLKVYFTVFLIYNITCSGAVSLPGYVEVKVLSCAGLQAHRVDP